MITVKSLIILQRRLFDAVYVESRVLASIFRLLSKTLHSRQLRNGRFGQTRFNIWLQTSDGELAHQRDEIEHANSSQSPCFTVSAKHPRFKSRRSTKKMPFVVQVVYTTKGCPILRETLFLLLPCNDCTASEFNGVFFLPFLFAVYCAPTRALSCCAFGS